MKTLRRDFLKQVALGAAAIPLVGSTGANAAADEPITGDPKLMGEAKYVDVDGIRTRYFDGGTGEAIVLVHGGQWPAVASARRWSAIFDHLAANFHVYAFDKLGMGYTDNPRTDADYSMGGVTRHAYGFIQALGLSRVTLVGHSRGALPIARIAVDHPELVANLVILDSNTLAPDDPNTPPRVDLPAERTPPTRDEMWQSIMANTTVYNKDFVTEAYVDAQHRIAHLPKIQEIHTKFQEARDRWIEENPEMVEQRPEFARNRGATTWWLYETKYETLDLIRAGNLTSPTLIVWGYNDPTAPHFLAVNLMETVSAVVDRAELHIINNCGHSVAEEQPEIVSRLITGFANG